MDKPKHTCPSCKTEFEPGEDFGTLGDESPAEAPETPPGAAPEPPADPEPEPESEPERTGNVLLDW